MIYELKVLGMRKRCFLLSEVFAAYVGKGRNIFLPRNRLRKILFDSPEQSQKIT